MLLAGLNAVLRSNSEVCRYFGAYCGIVLAVSCGGLSVKGRIGADGCLSETGRPADVHFRLAARLPLNLLRGTWDMQDIAVEGDSEIGWRLLAVLSQIRWQQLGALLEEMKALGGLSERFFSRADRPSEKAEGKGGGLEETLAALQNEIHALREEVRRLNECLAERERQD